MGEDSRKAIADACVATGKHFGVTIKVDELQARIGTFKSLIQMAIQTLEQTQVTVHLILVQTA